jgi:enamine deaminase RidA (YjgF/YER057c/UK114 family)
MERGNVNPWSWQNGFGFSQAVTVTGAERVVYCAGQAATDADGQPVHLDDIRAQVDQSFDNLETVLAAAGLSLANVVRLCYYTTDIDMLFANWDAIANRLARAGIQPASTLLGVTRLAFPENLIEIEATAVA